MSLRRTLAAGAIGTYVLMLAATLPYPLLDPFVAERFGTGAFETALFVSINLGAYVLLAPVWGRLADRVEEPRWLVGAGMLGQGAMLALLPWAPSFTWLLVLRFLEGAATILVMTVLHAAILDQARQTSRGVTMGAAGLGLALGTASGSALGGLLGARMLALPFLVGAGLLLVAALPVSLLLTPGHPEGRARTANRIGDMLRQEPRLIVPTAFSFLDRLTVGLLVGILPLFLSDVRGLDPALVGGLMSAFLLVFGLGQPVAGKLSDRLGRYPFVAGGSIAYGLVLIGLPLIDLPLLWGLMVAGGMVGALMFAPTFALVGDLAPPGCRGTGVALFHQAGSLGFAVGPLLGGAIVDLGGAQEAFLVVGLLELVAAVVLIAVLRRLTRQLPGAQPV